MRKKKIFALTILTLALMAMPALAQEGEAAAAGGGVDYGILGAGFAIGLAAALGAIGQGNAVSAACSAMARNPGSAPNVRFALILGLAFIESLVIYALLIALRGAGIF